MIRVFGLWPLAVGIVPHRDVASRLAFVVKATYAIPATPGETASLLPRQPPIRPDEPHPLAQYITGDDYAYASDLVPRKKEVDVTVTGSASATQAETSIFARISAGGVSRDFVAQSSAPALEIPLVSDYLRTPDGQAGARVAPGRPLGPRLRRARVASAAEAHYAPHFLDVATSEDGTGFQSASPEMRLPTPFDHRAEIFLESLGHRSHATGTQRWFWLPGFVPVAAVRGAGIAKEIPLVCDTVHFELDRDTVTLVHRAAIPIPLRGKHDLDIVVALAGQGDPTDAASLLSRMGEAKPLRVATLAPDGGIAWLPTPDVQAPSPRDPARAAALDFDEGYGSTEAVDASKVAAALPFAGIQAPPMERPARSSERPPDRAPPPPPSVGSLARFDQAAADRAPHPTTSTRDVEATNAFSVSSLLAKIGLSPDALAQAEEGSGGTLALTPEASAAALARAAGAPPAPPAPSGGGTLALTPEAAAAALARHAQTTSGDFDSTSKLSAADLMARVQVPPAASPPPPPASGQEPTQALPVSAELRALFDDSDDSGPGTLAVAPRPAKPAPVDDDDAGPGTLAIAGSSKRVAANDADDDRGPGTLAVAHAPPLQATPFDDTGELDAAKLAARVSLPFGPAEAGRHPPPPAEDAVAKWVERARAGDDDGEGRSGSTRAVDVHALLGAQQLPFPGKVPPGPPPPVVAPPAVVPAAPQQGPWPVAPPTRVGAGEPRRAPDPEDDGHHTRGVDIHALMARGAVPFAGFPSEPAPPSSRWAAHRDATPFSARGETSPDSVPFVVPAAAFGGRLGEVVPARTDARAAVLTFAWQLQPPQESLVIVAKASFSLEHGERARPLDDVELPLGDLFAEDDPNGSLIHASDLAPIKREVDILVKGHAHAPRGRATAMQVAVRLRKGAFRFTRELAVFGDRTWKGGIAPTEPAAFEAIPLAWERSFGGKEHGDNPVGVGFRGARTAEGRAALPNFEEPGKLIRSPDQSPPPAGLAAINPLWPVRWSRLGTYDAAYAKSRWPWFASDLDLDYFQAAPPGQRAASLDGDEEFELVGLHRERSTLRGSLPGIRLRAFAQQSKDAGGKLVEVPLRLDTLTFEPDLDRIHLVWRGRLDVSDDDAPELDDVFVTSEPLQGPAIDLEEARRRRAALDESTTPPGEEQAEAAAETKDEPLTPEEKAVEEQVRAAILDAEAAAGKNDASGPPAPVEPLDTKALLEGMRAVGASDDALGEMASALKPGGATDPPPPPAVDLRALVLDHLARGQPLAGLELRGADLRDLDLHDQSLVGADLSEAKLDRVDLTGADLSEARLEAASLKEAKLPGAKLVQADLFRADLAGAVLDGAVLDGVEAREATFERASLLYAQMNTAIFVQCRFHGADLGGVQGEAVDFTASVLDGANLKDAQLPEVRLYETKGVKVAFDHATLTGARAERCTFVSCSFREVLAAGSVWERAELTQSTFQGATLTESSFVRSTCSKTNFNETDLAKARLRKGKMKGATFVRANLIEADCQRTDLELADLRGACLHAAFLERTNLRHAKTEQAIVTQTLLDRA